MESVIGLACLVLIFVTGENVYYIIHAYVGREAALARIEIYNASMPGTQARIHKKTEVKSINALWTCNGINGNNTPLFYLPDGKAAWKIDCDQQEYGGD